MARDTIRHLKKGAFLAAYGRIGNVTSAATLAGVDRTTHYKWLEEDAAYVQAFAAAKEEAADWLETEAHRRAFLGVLKPIHHKGERVDYVREYSDTLLIFLLKGARPEKYRDIVRHEIEYVRREAERLAEKYGLDADTIVHEAEQIVKGSR